MAVRVVTATDSTRVAAAILQATRLKLFMFSFFGVESDYRIWVEIKNLTGVYAINRFSKPRVLYEC